MDPVTEPTPDQMRARLGELAIRLQRSREREQRRLIGLILRVGLFLGVPFVLAFVWVTTIGYQKHVLELRYGEGGVRMISRRSPFEISSPTADFAKPVGGGVFARIDDDLRSSSVQPRAYDWSSFCRTNQRVDISASSVQVFSVNEIPFRLAGGELAQGTRRWRIPSDRIVMIDLDRMALPNQLVPAPPPPSPITASPAMPESRTVEFADE